MRPHSTALAAVQLHVPHNMAQQCMHDRQAEGQEACCASHDDLLLSVQGLVASILFYTATAPFPGLYVLLRYDSVSLAWFASAVFWLLCVYLTLVSFAEAPTWLRRILHLDNAIALLPATPACPISGDRLAATDCLTLS
jgi:hypothetical protein